VSIEIRSLYRGKNSATPLTETWARGNAGARARIGRLGILNECNRVFSTVDLSAHNCAYESRKANQWTAASVMRNWRIHAVIVAWCLIALSRELRFPGWSGAIAVGGGVHALVAYATWKARHEVWYWLTISVLGLLQVPLMIHVQPWIVRLKFSVLFPFALADYLAFAVIMQCVALVFSKVYARRPKP
jgi:hypothetical protein